MTKAGKFFYIVAAFLLVCSICTCASADKTGKSASGGVRKARAFDRILISEISDYVGFFYYPHALHYYPRCEGGQGIPCACCHFEICSTGTEVPGPCRMCHQPSDERTDMRTRAL
ncbi:MAG: hypothetical protein E3J72_20325 [Planctomycetota bacterium]|nr:MAG: hypothetical protein E3J72_20325 [Planctomycetota bacterium]